MPTLLAVGLGYSVMPLATQLARAGWTVIGTTRDQAKADRFAAAGITPVQWVAGTPLPEAAVRQAGVIIGSVSPQEDGCPVAAALANTPIRPDAKLIYLSSSGVYGDFAGAWVDEDTPCTPETQRGQRRLKAEHDWQTLAAQAQVPLHICRLAGIYGPGRNAIESLRGDTPGAKAGHAQRIIKPGQVFNRIHRDDIVRGLQALIFNEGAPQLINFTDDEPAPPQDVVAEAARLLGLPLPPEVPFAAAKLSPMGRSFYRDNKRLKNGRLKALGGGRLLYPTYREGLASLVPPI